MKDIHFIKTKTVLRHVVVALTLLFSLGANAHSVMDNGHHVDTLSFAERISLHTNAIDLVLAIPNIGIEFDWKARNYNRWSVAANVRWRPSTTSTFISPIVFNIFEVSLEGRQYWRERQATPTGIFQFHRTWYQRILSCRSILPSHPTWAFYRGGYAAYTKYSMFMHNQFDGKEGTAVQAGFTWGFVKPLYQFSNGNSLDLDCGFSAGLAIVKQNTYEEDQENNEFYVTEEKGWRMVKSPVIKDLHVNFVYRFGNYPVQKRYRWRYDADMEFQALKDSLFSDAEARALQKYIADSVYRVVYSDFRHVYDSVLAVRSEEEKAARVESTKKEIETLKAESEQAGEALFDVEPGKTKKDKSKKKSSKSDAKEQNATDKKTAQVVAIRKEDNNEA